MKLIDNSKCKTNTKSKFRASLPTAAMNPNNVVCDYTWYFAEEQEDDKDGGGGDSKSEIRKRRKSSSTIADAASNGGVNSRCGH